MTSVCVSNTPLYKEQCGPVNDALCVNIHSSIQVDPAKYRNMFQALRLTASEDGVRALARGWVPTLFGYSMQGLFKFGFYEVFKIFYANMLGEVYLHLFTNPHLYPLSMHRKRRTRIVPCSTWLPVLVPSSLPTLLSLPWRL